MTSYDERTAEFKARIDAGEKIEAGDWMPDEYRRSALKFIEMHANSEVMGCLPEREWIPRAPSLRPRRVPARARSATSPSRSAGRRAAQARQGRPSSP